jgi:hypothetical protein
MNQIAIRATIKQGNYIVLHVPLYKKQYVRANFHFLKHLVESGKSWGAPWASSAFIYESLGGMLAECFKGSKIDHKTDIFQFLCPTKSKVFC